MQVPGVPYKANGTRFIGLSHWDSALAVLLREENSPTPGQPQWGV